MVVVDIGSVRAEIEAAVVAVVTLLTVVVGPMCHDRSSEWSFLPQNPHFHCASSNVYSDETFA